MKKILTILLITLTQTACVSAETTVPNTNNGRYVMYMNPLVRADQFILDTKTGKAWQLVTDKNGNALFQQMFYDSYNEDKTYSGRFTTPQQISN